MYCNQCGNAVETSASFCPRCGTKQQPASTGQPAEANVYQVSSASIADHPAAGGNSYYEAIIGPKNQAYYLKRFAAFDAAGKAGATWHWPAFLVSFYWFLYRKMWMHALAYFLLPYLALFLLGSLSGIASGDSHSSALLGIVGLGYLVYLAGILVYVPMYANAMYYKHCCKKIAAAKSASTDPQRQLGELAARGGTSNVVIFIVVFFVFFIGILAAVAIPAYQNYLARSQTAEAISLLDGMKSPVTQYYAANNSCPENGDGPAGDIAAASSISGIYVNSVHTTASSAGCIIIATMKKTGVAQAIAGGSLVLQMDIDSSGGVAWTCYSPDIKSQFLPKACQGGNPPQDLSTAAATPADQNDSARSQTLEALSLDDAFRDPVAQFYAANNSCPDNGNGPVGDIPVASSVSGSYVASVHITSDSTYCTIIATMKKTGVAQPIAGGSLALHMQVDANGNVSWMCSSPDLKSQFLPRDCQGSDVAQQ